MLLIQINEDLQNHLVLLNMHPKDEWYNEVEFPALEDCSSTETQIEDKNSVNISLKIGFCSYFT